MTYSEAIAFIESVSWMGSRPGLERIRHLCRLLGDPQDKIKTVHIAGTNGKGSVSAMTASVLSAAGHRTGLFTSPHLISLEERISVDGCDISKDELALVTGKVKSACDTMDDKPTEFEILTAVAFEYFFESGCDVAVIECGMGGRLDATNVIASPEVSVITNIALDHIKVLGDTLEKIAFEKAGIIKKSPVCIGVMPWEAKKVIEKAAAERQCDRFSADVCDVRFLGVDNGSYRFVWNGERYILPLVGKYQKNNLKCALTAIEILRGRGFDIDSDALYSGLSSVKWSGRFEILKKTPLVIYDGAHNPDGAKLTADTFEELYPEVKAAVVTGIMADKDCTVVARELVRVASAVFCVRPDNPRALSSDGYAEIMSECGAEKVFSSGSVENGVLAALEFAEKSGCPVLCAGSLYMYAEVRKAVEKYYSDKEK